MTTKQTDKKGEAKQGSQSPAKIEPTQSERFAEMVVNEFTGALGVPTLTSYQKRLVQNYFISTDLSLKAAEDKRLKKSENYRDKIAVTWPNVNMQTLALNVVACARIGYDPALPNHISMIPYKNNKTGKYDIGFIEGYRGRELKAIKYGFNPPSDIIVEVVHKNDVFKPIKKDKNNDIESYTFEISEDPFNRGDIIGGFYYHVYSEDPARNTLVIFNLHEIEKRKPKYAAPEFWGGEKAVWKNGQKTSETEKVEGWYREMVWKTIYRAAYGAITIDGQKIDDSLIRMMENESALDHEMSLTVHDKKGDKVAIEGNKTELDIQDVEEVKETPKEKKKEEAPAAQENESPAPY